MSLKDSFKCFFKMMNPDFDKIFELNNKAKNITKLLNKYYYNSDSTTNHLYKVGSVGRKTEINNINDMDIIFNFPKEEFNRFNNYKNNGQSSLLQEIRNILLQTYPDTNISGDGQVVVIPFNDFRIELNPGCKQSDDSFIFANSDNNGKWQNTKPFPEQKEAYHLIATTNSYLNLVHILRYWKRTKKFNFKGLLIDTFVADFLKNHPNYKEICYLDYLGCLRKLFKYLSIQDKDTTYWNAFGSNQEIFNDYNNDNGIFISKAKKTLTLLKEISYSNPNELIHVFRNLFGNRFPKYYKFNYTEQFPEDMFNMDIQYNISIKCKVTQNGFQNHYLNFYTKHHHWLKPHKTLHVKINYKNIPQNIINNITIYWKVRNVGPKAEEVNDVRGQIIKGAETKEEHTVFQGNHYVACYLVTDKNKCIAKSKISIPIHTT